ncbi:hypothetical protein EPK99_06440 [Neorhizobium lilium]|uniref:Putative DnaT-like domain-containing protein n=1 Tax=Neorhizobium lilium TaxID=2503024 RepID=A0A3S3S6V8_9HYPH|nr:DnaT-like ssDNA-binding protein [Neorhizobium lilium]RWX78267.1 hypothetical protein EPK99_06440 [Neorhizobium lilium]
MAGYLDIDAMQAYWAEQGYVVSGAVDTVKLTSAWNRGASVIDRYERSFSGIRSNGFEQEHAWGRNGATTYYDQAIPNGVVPVAIANASFEAAWLEYGKPGILSPVVTGSSVAKRKKVGQLEIEYASSSSTDIDDLVRLATPVVTAIEGLLWQFMRPASPAILVV